MVAGRMVVGKIEVDKMWTDSIEERMVCKAGTVCTMLEHTVVLIAAHIGQPRDIRKMKLERFETELGHIETELADMELEFDRNYENYTTFLFLTRTIGLFSLK